MAKEEYGARSPKLARLDAYTTSNAMLESCEAIVARYARVSNTGTPHGPNSKLVSYLIKHKHWSPFEMVNCVLEVNTTRDVSRQLLRHRSFTFQEFSQRYSKGADESIYREARLQDTKNRQSSLVCDDELTKKWWIKAQEEVDAHSKDLYETALAMGIAKEVARSILAEGLTPTRLFVNGTLRSWLHYIDLRTGVATQQEHRVLASAISSEIAKVFPMVEEFNHA